MTPRIRAVKRLRRLLRLLDLNAPSCHTKNEARMLCEDIGRLVK